MSRFTFNRLRTTVPIVAPNILIHKIAGAMEVGNGAVPNLVDDMEMQVRNAQGSNDPLPQAL